MRTPRQGSGPGGKKMRSETERGKLIEKREKFFCISHSHLPACTEHSKTPVRRTGTGWREWSICKWKVSSIYWTTSFCLTTRDARVVVGKPSRYLRSCQLWSVDSSIPNYDSTKSHSRKTRSWKSHPGKLTPEYSPPQKLASTKTHSRKRKPTPENSKPQPKFR
jgi:hypothetical protein